MVPPAPTAAPAALTIHTSTTLTNQLVVDGGVNIDGDATCNSSVHLAGFLTVSGNVYLTNGCTIDGDVTLGGTLRMDSASKIGGNVTAQGAVSLQRTVKIEGNVTTASTITSVDGVSPSQLVAGGTITGSTVEHATLVAVVAPRFNAAVFSAGVSSTTWASWMNAVARSNSAPTWSAGLTANPGCVMASWSSSVNGSTASIPQDTVVDARNSTSGCSSVKLQAMRMELSGDLTLYADSIEALTGTRFVSVDGRKHNVRLLVTGSTISCQANPIIVASDVTTDANTTVNVTTPGKLTLNGPTTLNMSADVGCLNSTGAVTVRRG